jgi:hypothetical protein
MKKLFIALTITSIIFNYSCKKKTCPAYNENQEEVYKISKNQKHKKAKLF